MSGHDYLIRELPLCRVLEHRDTPEVKIITGIRRCGKSTIMTMLADRLRDEGVPEQNIFHKRFDAFDLPLQYRAETLHDELLGASKTLDPAFPWYVLLDEIQDVEGWERVVRRLHGRPATDVYLTGSNARLLSSDLATHLTGRYVELSAFPLSFDEYVQFVHARGPLIPHHDGETSIDVLLADYLQYGGMPGLFELATRNERTIGNDLAATYQAVVYRDVAQRFGIRDLAGLDRVGRFLFSTAGSLFSARNVTNALNGAGHAVSDVTVSNMIRSLEQAFLIYGIEQKGIQGRAVLRPQKKYYPVDLGFSGLVDGFSGRNLGARLESAVALELLRRGWRVYVGAGKACEVDFVAEDPLTQQREYLQVSADIRNDKTRQRELAPLAALQDSFPRTVVTLDRFVTGATSEGIRIVHAADWLLGDR